MPKRIRPKHAAYCKAWRKRMIAEGKYDHIWRKYHLKGQYGLTLEQYKAMLLSQGNACAICRKPVSGRWLSVDHDHGCCGDKKACDHCRRGLLCPDCNFLLGNAKDNVTVLQNAIEYLTKYERHPC